VSSRPINWVFLGDSLTEGVGSLRATYVTELVNRLRESPARAVHEFRLRDVDPGFNRFIRVNVAGHLREDARSSLPALWVWNLASEGRTIDGDVRWLPLLENLRPERVFIHRGSLESILRPHCRQSGRWPIWVPRSWRGLVAMDPRCYFSDTPLRKLKQSVVDAAKQRTRLHLLREGAPQPLMRHDAIITHYDALLTSLRTIGSAVTMLGLLPPDDRTFPGSGAQFLALNARLQSLAGRYGVEFFDWHVSFNTGEAGSFYRDGFHPSPAGSSRLADILHSWLKERHAA
jgi:lysophospholipase L1-like esterase